MNTVAIFGVLAMVALILAASLSFLADLKRARSTPTASQRRDQNERIREAYMSKEQRAREMRERIRRERVRRERARESAGYRPTSGPRTRTSGTRSSGASSDWTATPTPPDEDRHRITLELVGDVTPDRLRSNYRRLVAAYHPDRVAGLGEKLQRLAEEETKSINEAYSFFKRQLGI